MNALIKAEPESLGLIRYDAMCTAIAECHRVDEVKDMRDKARAIEVYARQAKNTDAERKAADIRLRAERRTGELLRELERADAPNPAGNNQHREVVSNNATQPKSPYAETLDRAGISRQTASRYQALANVPAETFERHLADPEQRPTTNKIIREARAPQPEIDPNALRIWGKARDFERHRDADFDPREMFDAMTETMQADMRRLAPLLADYWQAFVEEISL